ncbi:MAG: DNA-binding response regulator [Deltaproteobacteria bacterium HGW-Deltaproteobacteria-18]|jgi:DNA-binding response OmpR family regulator|nr:MAG: DNA-binding response regulator [Deltaproteobacteria bacterium HGW-Deltaproteobacteria-18]
MKHGFPPWSDGLPKPGTPILLIDDDRDLCALLQEYCAAEGLALHPENSGAAGIPLALSEKFDLVILDVMMPGMSGMDTLRAIRSQSMVPVLMLTAMGDDMDRILGLELGADDYVPKPCTPRELVARIRAILRRSGMNREPDPEILSSGDLVMWPGKRTVLFRDVPLNLTGTEFSILEILLRHAGKPVSREVLCENGLGRPLTRFDRSLDVHLSSIRHKMGHSEDGRSPIQTLRGRGYQLLWA